MRMITISEDQNRKWLFIAFLPFEVPRIIEEYINSIHVKEIWRALLTLLDQRSVILREK